jgi:hypothetical protein
VKLLAWVAAGAVAYWAITRLGPDPKEWPDAAVDEIGRIKGRLKEAAEAGKRAAADKEQELLDELERA